MANHTFTISTYSDNTLSEKIGEITFSANLLDYGEQGIILEGIITEGGGLEQYINIQMFHVQSTYGIYDKIHKVILENILFFETSLFNFVTKY